MSSASGGGQPESTDGKHRKVINSVRGDTSFACASERRVGSAFQSRSDRHGKSGEAAILLNQGPSFVTALSQFVERLPHFRMALPKLVDSLRQLRWQANYLPIGFVPRILDESLAVAYLRSEDVLNELASFLHFWHGQRKIDILAFAASNDDAGRSEHHCVL